MRTTCIRLVSKTDITRDAITYQKRLAIDHVRERGCDFFVVDIRRRQLLDEILVAQVQLGAFVEQILKENILQALGISQLVVAHAQVVDIALSAKMSESQAEIQERR